ncbi:MAG: hypothetical protein ACOCV3_00460 [Halanaerobiales bacterium]
MVFAIDIFDKLYLKKLYLRLYLRLNKKAKLRGCYSSENQG